MCREHGSHTWAEGAGMFCGVLERRPGTKRAWGWESHRIQISAHWECGTGCLSWEWASYLGGEQVELPCQSGYQRSLLDGL